MLSHRGYRCDCGRAVLCPFESQFGPSLWMIAHDHASAPPHRNVKQYPMPVSWVTREVVEL